MILLLLSKTESRTVRMQFKGKAEVYNLGFTLIQCHNTQNLFIDYYEVLRSFLSACSSLALILNMLQLHKIVAL